MHQLGFTDAEYGGKRKRTRREVFLAEMHRAVPWSQLEALIAPHYPKAGGGRRPYPLATMLRIHCLQQWYGLSDPAMEEELYETTILNFRHLLERHGLAREIFETVTAHLQAAGLLLRQGTIVDATIISAPSSTKNSTGERDPEMHQTKKGNQWYFGMKAHVGVDAETSLVHSVIGTAANVADVTPAHERLHGSETVAFGDAGDIGVEHRPERKRRVEWQVAMKPGKRRALRDTAAGRVRDRIEHLKAQVRARGAHAFRVIKRQFGYLKVRYRGLTKNTAQLHTLFALANIWMVRRQLLATG